MQYLYSLFFFALLPCLSIGLSPDASPQEILVDKFFGKNRLMSDVLPKKNMSDSKPLKVNFTFIIPNIFEIKSDEEELDLGVLVTMKWKNELVNWNKSDYPVKHIEVPIKKIWIPSLILHQNVLPEVLKPSAGENAVVKLTGITIIEFGTRIKIKCSMPACLFPVDKHKCTFSFEALHYGTDTLVLVHDTETRRNYDSISEKSTGLWRIKTEGVTDTTNDDISAEGEKHSTLSTYVTFQHKPGHFWLHILFPIALICTVTFFAVLFPRENGERTSLLITCFLAQFVYLDTVSHIMPRTSDYVPLLVIFVFVVLMFTACQIVLTAIVAYYAEKSNNRVALSPRHERIIMFLSKICTPSKRTAYHAKNVEENNGFDSGIKMTSTHSLEHNHPSHPTPLSGEAEDTQGEGNADLELEDSTDGKRADSCKAMCDVIDRISVILSWIVLIATPILFMLMYDGIIKIQCSTS